MYGCVVWRDVMMWKDVKGCRDVWDVGMLRCEDGMWAGHAHAKVYK
jgi:hypothetical protein